MSKGENEIVRKKAKMRAIERNAVRSTGLSDSCNDCNSKDDALCLTLPSASRWQVKKANPEKSGDAKPQV